MDLVTRVIALAAPLVLAACAGQQKTLGEYFPQPAGLTAQLRSPSSSATGVVHVFDRGDGVQLQMVVSNMIPGQYRVAIHENGNCRSPNLFSAGPPWAPPGSDKPATELLPGFLANMDGNQNGYVAHLKGVSVDGPNSLKGKSIVIHAGSVVGQAFPGQPNNRMACGVLMLNSES
jgi:Cu/Zn superoxide dismutase